MLQFVQNTESEQRVEKSITINNILYYTIYTILFSGRRYIYIIVIGRSNDDRY